MKELNKKNIFIRLEEIALKLNEPESFLIKKITDILNIKTTEIINYKIIKKALDSRRKSNILFIYSVDVEVTNPKKLLKDLEEKIGSIKEKIIKHKARLVESYAYNIKLVSKKLNNERPIIIGSGPSGLFAALVLAKAGLKPLLIERGKDVAARIKDVDLFFNEGKLNINSNIQFGEGGAGTFSDGKLYTLINDPRKKFIFEEFISSGAPEEIATDAHPHIGTDKIREAIKNIRQEIINLGGEVRFETCLTDLETKNNKITYAIFNNKERIKVNELILAVGHSARDTYAMLLKNKLDIEAKSFSIGLRIEHNAETMKKIQYGNLYQHPNLPAARYALACHIPGYRSVYTFCMCPGGYVIAAASEDKTVVTNGMSEYARDGKNSNSALLVNVFPSDFESTHPLAGVEFQRKWEKKAFVIGGSNYKAPAQSVGDFLKDKKSNRLIGVKPTYKPGVTPTSLNDCLPDYITSSIREALPIFNQKIKGFSNPDAVLTGVETRSSSPIRIIRGETMESNIKGVYPIGEGAGYAGGIISSAIDGLKVAEIIIEKYLKK
jgi:uncharacterized FAD-dependent dehydrogenase